MECEWTWCHQKFYLCCVLGLVLVALPLIVTTLVLGGWDTWADSKPTCSLYLRPGRASQPSQLGPAEPQTPCGAAAGAGHLCREPCALEVLLHSTMKLWLSHALASKDAGAPGTDGSRFAQRGRSGCRSRHFIGGYLHLTTIFAALTRS